MKTLTNILRLLVVLVLLAGCSGAPTPYVPSATPAPSATTPPQVLPTASASAVPSPTKEDLSSLLKAGSTPSPTVLQSLSGGGALTEDGAIEVAFDQPMNPDTTTSAFTLVDSDGKTVAGKVSWPAPALLRFAPAQPLKKDSTYQVRLASAATSTRGAALKDAVKLDVATTGAIQVGQVFPADGTQGVAVDSAITVLFNRPIVPLVILEEKTGLPDPLKLDPPVEGKGEWVNTSVYIFHPAQNLQTNKTYTVTVPAGLADAAGKLVPLEQDFSWKFTTLPPTIDKLNLRTSEKELTEINNSQTVYDLRLDPAFHLGFFQAMDPASTEAALSLVAEGGQHMPLSVSWNAAHTAIDFSPVGRLSLATNYNLTLSTEAHAADGSPLAVSRTWNFRSVLVPQIESTNPREGDQFVEPNLDIIFASPMNINSVISRVVFDPPLEGKNNWYYDSGRFRLTFYGLKYSTQYRVQLQAGMTDLYGNTLINPQSLSFTTRTRPAEAWLLMPDRAQYRADVADIFYTRLVNVKTATFSLYRMTQEQVYQFSRSGNSTRPAESELVWRKDYQNNAATDQVNLLKLPISGEEGGKLAKGFYLLGMDSPEITTSGLAFDDQRLLTVADSNLMFKLSPKDALAWVTDLTSGQPVAGAEVKVYDQQNQQQVALGTTGADGLVKLDMPERTGEQVYQSLLAIVDDGQHFAYAESGWGSGVSPYEYGIWDQYYQAPQAEMAYLYTDRPIYRPGQPIYFKGILRADDDLKYSMPSRKEINVVIRNYKDETVYDQVLPISDMGSFDGTFTLDAEAPLGTYVMQVIYPSTTNYLGTLTFNVAEYRRPEFQLKLETSPSAVLAGGDFSANLKADYYSGGGVAKANVSWNLRSQSFAFTPPSEFSGYSFNNLDYDTYYNWRSQPQNNNDNLLAEGSGVTDEQGRLTLTLPAKLKTDASQRLVLETNVTDFAGTQVSARAEVVAHHSLVYPGVRFDGYLGTEGKEQRIDLLALDWDGKPVAGQTVDVQIVERRWNSVQEQDQYGNLRWNSSVEEIPVTSFSGIKLDQDGKGSVSYTPPKGGVYKVTVTARDPKGNAGLASSMQWVTGKDYIPWQQTNDRGFQLITDRKEYRPGDTAEVMIASPFQGEAYALVTVERGRIRKQEVLKLESNSTVYRLPITANMAPNVYLSVVVVKGVDEANPRPNFKIGMSEISVATDLQQVQVKVAADKASAGPGEPVTYTVTTTDTAGKPVEAEVSLGLSDLATLSLAPANSAPILQGFYDRRGLRVTTAMALVNSIEDYNATIKATEQQAEADGRRAGSGGGKGEGDLGVMEIRQDFPDTAFWRANVRTDGQGQASVTVRLPDNLTTWRMDARAVTQDTRVGQTTFDLVSSKPLLVRPQTPRFFVAGDQATLGAAVHNNTGSDLDVSVALEGKGVDLLVDASQQVSIKAGQQAYVTWQVKVQEAAERVDLVFSAKSGQYSDASRPTIGSAGQDGLAVYRYEAPESVAASGQLTQTGAQSEVIRLPQEMQVSQGELTVNVSPSLSASITDGLTYLENFPYECIEQTVSRFLPNVMVTKVLKEAGVSDPALEENLKKQVSLAIQRLSSWQHQDGGWGWWKDDASDDLITAYATLGLLEAKDAGYTVPENMLSSALSFMITNVSRTNSLWAARVDHVSLGNRQAFILYVLARAQRPETALVTKLYEDRLQLGIYGRALLLRAIWQQDPTDPRIDALRSDFASAAILSASGTHWEEASPDRWNWNTDTRTTAIVLGSLVPVDPQNPLVANAVRWLMSHRTQSHWGNTQETAWTLMSLADWMRASGELKANYAYAVQLNQNALKEGQVTADNLRETQTMKVAVADLLKDAGNELVFARGEGQGNLYYTADLKVWLPVPKLEAIDQGMVLTRAYYPLNDPNQPVQSAEQGETLRARLTIVVPHALHYVQVDDPLPAGLEAVDTSLLTSPQGVQPEGYSWNKWDEEGWGWWYFSNIQLHDEKVSLSASYLPAGTYTYTYLVRASTPGVFNVIPPTGQEFYFPEVYGRGEGMSFEVK